MLKIQGYTNELLLEVNDIGQLYSSRRDEDHLPVHLYVCPPGDHTREARLQHLFGLISKMRFPGVARALSLFRSERTLVMALERFEGERLSAFLKHHQLDKTRLLKMMVDLALILSKIHAARVIHRAIQPKHILINPSTQSLQITGFEHAVPATRERKLVKPELVTDHLPYISPEQTGRMGREEDYRSDLYSLGITYYEMIFGHPPFRADPKELIHLHLAGMVRFSRKLLKEKGYPLILERIIKKLLEKDPESRYQTARGLQADLVKTLEDENKTFKLGTEEVPDALVLPSHLYGRTHEMDVLRRIYQNVRDGTTEMVTLAGPPGVGKTTLVQAFRKSIHRSQHFFLKGKFDRFQKTKPFSGFIEAFSGWVDQILTGSDEQMALWRTRLNEAMGHVSQVMIEIVPNLKWILESREEIPSLGPTETQNRLKLSMLRFACAIATPDTPMILFLDDIQWADFASLNFIESLMLMPQKASLLIITSFCPQAQEENVYGPLMDRLREKRCKPLSLTLQPWSFEEANAFIADALARKPEETRELTELIKRKTDNNPLFVRQFLLHAYGLGLIFFNTKGGWHWNANAIEQAGIPDNLANMMTDKIAKLPEEALTVLELAGCLGNGFSPEMISAISELDEDGVAKGLYYLTLEGLVAPTGLSYHFTHDRIFEAAINLLPAHVKERYHLAIGTYLQRRTTPEKLGEKVFGITKHLNRCLHLITLRTERRQLAELNLLAGRKSLEASAYTTAEQHFLAGLTLVNACCWEEDYQLLFDLHLKIAECKMLSGAVGEADGLFRDLLKHDLKIADHAHVVARRVDLSCLSGDVKHAVEIGLAGLAFLGVRLPEKPSNRKLIAAVLGARLVFTRRKEAALAKRPLCEDPLFLAKMKILLSLILPAYFHNARLTLYLNLYNMRTLLKQGNHPEAHLVVALFALVLGSVWGTNQDRYRLGRLSQSLMERLGNPPTGHRSGFVVWGHINPWVKPLRRCVERLREIRREALEQGDHQYAIFISLEQLALSFYCGDHLATLYEETRSIGGFVREAGGNSLDKNCQRLGWVICFLRGESEQLPHLASADPFQLEKLKLDKIRASYYFVAPFSALAFFYMGRIEEAFEISSKLFPRLVNYVPFIRQTVENTFIYAMSSAMLYPSAGKQRRKKLREIMKTCYKLFQKWARHGPANHLAQKFMVAAETARMNQKAERAWYLYTAAENHAQKNNFVHLLGLVHERMATFALDMNWEQEVSRHFNSASDHYIKWGALAKERQIQALYGAFLTTDSVELEVDLGDRRRTLSKGALDLSTVVESSLAISQEVELGKVLQRVMASAIENAGAQRGLLLLKSEDGLLLEAEGSVNGGFLRIPCLDPADSSAQIPMTIVRYVQRTRETVVLDDARARGLFKEDPYIIEARARSVLMMPILTQNQFVGILYLENNLVGDTFSQERTEVLRVIAAQAAIALQNARLYDELSLLNHDLEKRVEARTAQLRETNLKLTVEVEERIKTEKDLMDLQSKLVETARRAGMTEVAIGVLHNVGNVLNSVTISATCLSESFKNSRIPQLDRLVELLRSHKDDLAEYITRDARGQLFPAFLEKLASTLNRQREKDTEEVIKLTQHLSHAIEVIRAQQAQANVKAVLEPVDPTELIEHSIKINAADICTADVELVRRFSEMPILLVDKHKVLQILINLIKNGVQSIHTRKGEDRRLVLAIERNREGSTVFTVEDFGVGIAEENLSKVFSYGFTTKVEGNGFGLHNAANAATEMGGSLSVKSEGTNRGATFTLSLPLGENRIN